MLVTDYEWKSMLHLYFLYMLPFSLANLLTTKYLEKEEINEYS